MKIPFAIRLLVLATLTMAAFTSSSQATQPIRSVANIRALLPDMLRGPRTENRQTHRGWEVRRNQFTVVANSRTDALQVARAYDEAWTRTLKLADNFSSRHRAVGFGANSTLIYVDRFGHDEGRRSQNYPVGAQYVVHLAPTAAELGDPKQLEGRVHAASVDAFAHVTQLNQVWPAWLKTGMANYVAHSFSEDFHEVIPNSRNAPAAQPNRWLRRNSTAAEADPEAGAWVQFLLEGDNGMHAGAFFDYLSTLSSIQGDRDPRATPKIDDYRTGRDFAFAEWRKSPDKPPALLLSKHDSPELRQLQIDLFTVLRLARRWHGPLPAESSETEETKAVPNTSTVNVSEFNVTEFKPGKFDAPGASKSDAGTDDETKEAQAKPAQLTERGLERDGKPVEPKKTPKAKSEEKKTPELVSIPGDEIRRQLIRSKWSINRPGGGWLNQDNGVELEERIELASDRVRIQRIGEHWAVAYQWDQNHSLVGHWTTNKAGDFKIQFRLIEAPFPKVQVKTNSR